MHSIRSIITVAFLMLLASLPGLFETSVSGQSPQQSPPKPVKEPEQDEAIRLSSRLIMVPVSASDAAGQPVKDLKVEDIVIEEEGKPQQVVALGEPGKTPVEIALLFDVSGSTHAQFDFERQAAVQFVKEVLKPSDTVSIFSIGVTPKLVRERTANSAEAIAGIGTIGPLKEPTAFFDAVVESAQYMDKVADPGSRRVLVVISDGQENFSKKSSLSDALREVQKGDCLFYAINPNGGELRLNNISLKGQGVLDSLAAQTGGMAFTLRKVEELEAVFRQIAAELQAQYLFGYYSNDEKSDGSFKKLTVRAPKRPDLRIRSRQGYYTGKK